MHIEEKIETLEKTVTELKIQLEESKANFTKLQSTIVDPEREGIEFAQSASNNPYIKSLRFKARDGPMTKEWLEEKLKEFTVVAAQLPKTDLKSKE